MKISPAQFISSVRSSASKVVSKGIELKEAVAPVITGPSKSLPTFYYCADGSAVVGPVSPDALYKLVWLDGALAQKVPVSLAGTEKWTPFLTLEDALFSKKLVWEVTKVRAQRAAEQIRLAAEEARAKAAEEQRLAAMERRRKTVHQTLAVCGALAVLLACAVWFGPSSKPASPYIAPASVESTQLQNPTANVIPSPSLVIREASVPAPSSTTYSSKPNSAGTVHVNGYTRKDGTYVHGYTRRK